MHTYYLEYRDNLFLYFSLIIYLRCKLFYVEVDFNRPYNIPIVFSRPYINYYRLYIHVRENCAPLSPTSPVKALAKAGL